MFAKKQAKLFDPMSIRDDRKEAMISNKIGEALGPGRIEETTLVYRRPEIVIDTSGRPRHLFTGRMEGRKDLEYVPDGEGFGVRFGYEVHQ